MPILSKSLQYKQDKNQNWAKNFVVEVKQIMIDKPNTSCFIHLPDYCLYRDKN